MLIKVEFEKMEDFFFVRYVLFYKFILYIFLVSKLDNVFWENGNIFDFIIGEMSWEFFFV